MADDEGALTQFGGGNHGADFFGAKLRVVVRSPGAVTHAGQVDRRDAKVPGEVWRNVAPPIAMRTAAMNEKKAAAGRPRRLACPIQVVDPAARYHHELRLPGVGNGPPKPIGRRRADSKQIGWYGFAAQGGCTRITGWDLAADRPTLYRTKGPCSFRNPPSTALSRGPRCLPHARSLGVSYSGEVGPGAIHPSPPRGTEGSNPSLSSRESVNL